MTLGVLKIYFPFFGSHNPPNKNFCCNHIFILALNPTTILYLNLEFLHVIHISLFLYIVFLLLLVQHGESNLKCPRISIKVDS